MNGVKVEVGDTVMVLDGSSGRNPKGGIRGTVVKAARVWIDIHREGSNWGWRLRRDTQNDGRGIGYGTHFFTLDQWATRQREASADKYLREQGITVEFRSSWRGRTVELATLLGWTDTSQTIEPDNQEG